MHTSQSHPDFARKRVRRETHLQALYISFPAWVMALYHLLFAAGFYFRPLVLLGLLPPERWKPMEVSPAVETSLLMGLPLMVSSIGVYLFAVWTLSRIKAGKPVFRSWR